MNDLKEIVDRLIREGFIELMAENIIVEYEDLDNAFLIGGRLKGGGYYIDVGLILKDTPVHVKEGGIAHELVHIVDFKMLGKLRSEFEMLAYKFFKRYRVLDERDTDLQVIRRGYGSQLLAFLEFAECQDLPWYKGVGLSSVEVKQILEARVMF